MTEPTIVSFSEERAKAVRLKIEEAMERWIDSIPERDLNTEVSRLHANLDRVETLLEELLRRVVTLEAR